MKRFLLLLLLAVLPIQIPWAAGVTHCLQGGDDGAYTSARGDGSHAAHAHVHEAGDGDEGHTAGAGPDCSVIHFVALEPSAVRTLSLPQAGATAHAEACAGHESHIPDGLERPNWRLAA